MMEQAADASAASACQRAAAPQTVRGDGSIARHMTPSHYNGATGAVVVRAARQPEGWADSYAAGTLSAALRDASADKRGRATNAWLRGAAANGETSRCGAGGTEGKKKKNSHRGDILLHAVASSPLPHHRARTCLTTTATFLYFSHIQATYIPPTIAHRLRCARTLYRQSTPGAAAGMAFEQHALACSG